MRYRILIITYKNGRIGYEPQRKVFIGWQTLWGEVDKRKDALFHIDQDYKNRLNKTMESIEIEYITK